MKTSRTELVSPGTRRVASEKKATCVPFVFTDTPLLAPLSERPKIPTLAKSVAIAAIGKLKRATSRPEVKPAAQREHTRPLAALPLPLSAIHILITKPPSVATSVTANKVGRRIAEVRCPPRSNDSFWCPVALIPF
jgi:hypothetical protein